MCLFGYGLVWDCKWLVGSVLVEIVSDFEVSISVWGCKYLIGPVLL